MLGTWRLVLAMAVALSHDGVRILGLNPGVMAVVGFYLISGYVMTALLRRHYVQPARIPAFYADRALRLFPAYLAVSGLTVLWWLLTGSETTFLRVDPAPRDWLNNLLVVPLNFYMVNGSDGFTLIPPAWSLGAEIQFYLLVPFILLIPRARTVLLLLAVGVQLAAATGWLHADWFGYRLLPGALLFFLLGSWLCDRHGKGEAAGPKPSRHLLLALPVSIWVVLLYYNENLREPYLLDTALGLLVGFIVLDTLAGCRRRAWDEYLGHLSYSVFLVHFLVIWAVGSRPDGIPGHLVLLVVTFVIAVVVNRLVERPALRLRHRWRRLTGGRS